MIFCEFSLVAGFFIGIIVAAVTIAQGLLTASAGIGAGFGIGWGVQ